MYKELLHNIGENKRRYNYLMTHHNLVFNLIVDYNKDLNIDNFTQKIYNYVYEISVVPKCQCGNYLKFISFTMGYRKFCSVKCSMLDKNIIEKRNKKSQETCVKKYGVVNPMMLDEFKNKLKLTNIKNYGVDCYSKSDQFKRKIILSNNNKYGKDWYFQTDEFRNKSRDKCIKLYDVDHHTKTDNYKIKTKKSNVEKWGVDCFVKTEDFKKQMSEYYKSEDFLTSITKRKTSLKSKIFEYYKNYNNNYELLNIIASDLYLKCKVCNNQFVVDKQLFYLRNKSDSDICIVCNPKYGKNTSIGEKEVFRYIKTYRDDAIENFKIDKFELDIYIPDLKIGFEFNGLYWHSEINKQKNYHINKTCFFKQRNILVFNIWEDDWKLKHNIIKSMILCKLNKIPNKIYARKCEIKIVEDNKLIRKFLEENHIQGFCKSSYKIGLFLNGELVSLMTFLNLRTLKCELLRFCNKTNMIVIGGASKLFKFFLKRFKPKQIISYSDFSIFNGNIYKQLGFSLSHLTKPNYYWCKSKIRYNRKLRKGKYFKLYDSGMQKWTFN